MADEKPRSAASQSLRTLGLFLLVFLGPLLLLRGACVSHREICEGHGGRYGEVGTVHVCALPNGQACPPTYHYSEHGEGCTSRRSLPGVWRWDSW